MQTDQRIAQPAGNLALRLWSEAAVLAMIGMELTWITALYVLTMQLQSRLAMTVLVLAVALAGSYALGRGMHALHWRLGLRRIIFLAWLVFYVFFSLNRLLFPTTGLTFSGLVVQPLRAVLSGQWEVNEFWHVLVICLLGLRGISLATREVEQSKVLASLQLGLLMFLLYGLSQSAADPAGTAWLFFIFLAFGMLSLSAAGVAGISDLRGGRLPRLTWTWTTGILASALLAAGIAVLSGWLISSQEISTFLGQIVLGFFTVLLALIGLLISPLVLLFFWGMTQISQLLSGLIDRTVFDAFIQSLKQMTSAGKNQSVAPVNVMDIRNVVMGAAVAAIILITLILFRRLPKKRRLLAEEDSLNTGANRRPYPPESIGKDSARWINPRRLLAAAQVRRIYAQLMALCEKSGYPRPVALTPLEFLPTLKQVFPEGASQVSLITSAYIRVRYGELPESAAEVKDIKLAWEWLKGRAKKK